MDKIVLYFFLLMSLAVTAFGVYFTIFSREDPLKHEVPSWVTKHVKTLKWLGPVLIGVGVLGLAGSVWSLTHGIHEPSHNPGNSNFGFKFY
uniref:Uncharacterized protein n=1 Tax=viral metagenome TaxID=1070528 RepID=A0A6C0JPE4_9ZZZZ